MAKPNVIRDVALPRASYRMRVAKITDVAPTSKMIMKTNKQGEKYQAKADFGAQIRLTCVVVSPEPFKDAMAWENLDLEFKEGSKSFIKFNTWVKVLCGKTIAELSDTAEFLQKEFMAIAESIPSKKDPTKSYVTIESIYAVDPAMMAPAPVQTVQVPQQPIQAQPQATIPSPTHQMTTSATPAGVPVTAPAAPQQPVATSGTGASLRRNVELF